MTSEVQFGKYTLLERLGAGGMAEVFKSRLSGIGGFDKIVVIKRILPERLEEPEFIHMFLDEARIAANLNHPNVIHIFEVDEIDGAPYIAMEYVRGPTLSALMRTAFRHGNAHLGHAVKILSSICAGLYYVHNARDSNDVPLEIIHRDISPQNIIISLEGVPKLLDFGVARAAGRLSQTQAGMFKGKLRYTSPEQMRGQPIDHRVDIYAMGVCLFEATTGRARFGNLAETQMVSAILEGRVEAPSSIVPEYPPELEKIVMWALEANPEKRCPDAQALHQALEGFVASGPYASSTAAVAQWLTEVFPPADTQSYGRMSTRTTSTRPALPRSDSSSYPSARSNSSIRSQPSLRITTASPPPPPQEAEALANPEPAAPPPEPAKPLEGTELALAKRRAGRQRLLLAISAAVLLLGGTIFALRAGTSRAPAIQEPVPATAAPPQPVATETPAPPPQPPAPPSAEDTLRAYLDEAERFAKEHQTGPALEMLAKAQKVQSEDPTLTVRRERLVASIEQEALLLQARTSLNLKDGRVAAQLAKQVLDKQPDQAEAIRILAEARQLDTPAPTGRPRGKQRMGLINVISEPPGMVYLDDEPLGLAPLRQRSVPEGRHQLEVRLAGYEPQNRTLHLQDAKPLTLRLTLKPAGGSQGAGKPSQHDVPAGSPPSPGEPPSLAPVAALKPEPPEAPKPAEPAAASVSASTEAPAVAARAPVREPPPAPAPAPPVAVQPRAAAGSPRLPATYSIRSAKDLGRVIRIIEKETVDRGQIDPGTAQKAFAPLTDELLRTFSPGQPIEVYPRAMYYFVVEAAGGQGNDALGQHLLQAHLDGSLRARSDR